MEHNCSINVFWEMKKESGNFHGFYIKIVPQQEYRYISNFQKLSGAF